MTAPEAGDVEYGFLGFRDALSGQDRALVNRVVAWEKERV